MDEYMLQWLANQRTTEIREFCQRLALARAVRPPRRPIRLRLGLALIRAGRWLLRRVPDWADERRRRVAGGLSREAR
jgi:hypothetical protein